jgi:uncharacterized membrane protein YczE
MVGQPRRPSVTDDPHLRGVRAGSVRRMRQHHSPPELRRRLPRLLFGLVLCGMGIAAMVAADLGLGPWDVLHQGIAQRTGIPIGTTVIVVGVAVMLLWVPLRERPGLGTVLNAILIGLVIDLTLLWLSTPTAPSGRWALMLGGVALFGVGSGFYIGAGLGPGPRDGVMTGLARRGWPVGVVRTAIELSALGSGWVLGGTVGVGTVVFAFGIGPLVHWTLPRLTIAPVTPPEGVRSAR